MTGESLPKSSLVRKNRHYSKVYREGKRLYGKGFTMVYCHNPLVESRLGISVQRTIRGAVKRNRIKRIIRESFRRDRCHYPKNCDIVIAVRNNFSCEHPRDVSEAVLNVQDTFGRKE